MDSTYQYIANPETSSQQLLSAIIKLWLLVNFVTGPFALFYGVDNIKECPSQPLIPIFLVVQGVLSLILVSLIIGCFISCNDEDKATCKFKSTITFIAITTIGLIVWHIIGSTWVFTIYKELQEDGACANSCYMLAFSLIVISIICYGLSFLLSLCLVKDNLCQSTK